MEIIIPVVSLLSWCMIEVMVYMNPSGTIPLSSPDFITAVFYGLSAVASLIVPRAAFGKSTGNRFFTLFFGGFIFLLLMAILGGALFHRDFHVYGTQAVMLYFIIFLLRFNDLGLIRRKQQVYNGLFIGALTAFALWIVWLMLMSYTIVVRQEPRWIESTGYNLLNGIIGLLLVYATVLLREHSRRTVCLRDGQLFLDGRNITELLSPQENRILQGLLLATDQTQTCSALVSTLKSSDEDDVVLDADCTSCLAERWTATACSAYRNLKNRIAAIKKYLELLQIGTIVPVSENPREIKEAGWRLRFFDDVRLEPIKRP